MIAISYPAPTDGSAVLLVRQRGTICEVRGNFEVHLIVTTPPIRIYKGFTSATHTSREHAKQEAERYLLELNVQYGLTKTISRRYYSSYVHQYIAGFLDGDGCIGLSGNSSFTVSFGQSSDNGVPVVLERIRNLYGGGIRKKKVYGNRKVPYELVIFGEDTLPLLYDLRDALVMKYEQARLVYDFLRNRKGKGDEVAPLREKLSKLKTEYASLDIDANKITSAYLGGLFDAEGCIIASGVTAMKVDISQDGCPPLLEAINQRYGNRGYFYKIVLSFHGDLAYDFLQEIRRYTCVKRSQVDAVLSIRNYRNKHSKLVTVDERDVIHQLQETIRIEKRR